MHKECFYVVTVYHVSSNCILNMPWLLKWLEVEGRSVVLLEWKHGINFYIVARVLVRRNLFSIRDMGGGWV